MILGYYKYIIRLWDKWKLYKNFYIIEMCVLNKCFWYLGKVKDLIDFGNNIYGGKYVINFSGGFIFKGYFLGVIGKEL